MLQALPFTLVYLLAATLLVGMWLGGAATSLTPFVVFVVLPLADRAVGHDTSLAAPEGSANPWFDRVLRAWVPAQLALLLAVLHHVTHRPLAWYEWAGILASTALVIGAVGITVAHELMHRKAPADRALAEALMLMASYPHFCIEHVLGHHRNVGTPLDPATSRLGESLYAFYPRVVWGSLRSAIHLERERIRKRGIPWYDPRNRLLRYAVELAVGYAAVALLFGWVGLAFYVAQGVLAATLLEMINYVEHYGLARRRAGDRWETVQPRHSWNANNRVSNWWLFNLQRHADHHAYAARPYWQLRAVEDGPQLPASYPVMVLLALVPPLWRRVMDPRAAAQDVRPNPSPWRPHSTPAPLP
jgi:alkane 1-monooxygenase